MTFRIAHISDLHCGSPYFLASLLERTIVEINRLQPDVVVCSGDLTTFGYRQEYLQARAYIDRLDCADVIVIPGNHDSRNVGYEHFEELFGERQGVLRKDDVCFLYIDSSEPDLDHGIVGRGRYQWIRESSPGPPGSRLRRPPSPPADPGSGRERNVVYDAGDALEVLGEAGCHLVLSGHKHVTHSWRLENLFVVNAGTVSTLRLRGRGRPSYNVVELGDDDTVAIRRVYPFHDSDPILEFSLGTLEHRRFPLRDL